MKIRNGFVSNSSSSSFVVAFTSVPETKKELIKMLFDEEQQFVSPCYCDNMVAVSDAAARVLSDLENDTPLSRIEAIRVLSSGYHDRIEVNYDKYRDETGNIDWNAVQSERQRLAEILLDELLAPLKRCELYCFRYSDNEGDFESTMEHGNVFEKLPHIRISNH
jgi:hypothetical protein